MPRAMVEVRFGIHLPSGGFRKQAFSRLRDLVVEAEGLGFASVWVPDHLIYPEALGPPNIYEPLVSLAALSSVTQRILLGTAVLLPLRHPLAVANMVSTLDHASGGRVMLGMGVGWFRPEFDACGVPFNRRGRVQEETIRLLKALWTKPTVDFEGKYFKLRGAYVNPKPIQKPHPPIWLGGAASQTFHRLVRLGDGWIPWCPSLEAFGEGVKTIRRFAEDLGRDFSKLQLAPDILTCIKPTYASAREEALRLGMDEGTSIIGDPSRVAERVKQYVSLGATHIILGFRPPGRELEAIRLVAEEVFPRLKP